MAICDCLCLENANLPSCVWFQSGDKRNSYASIFAGLLFFAGWWIIIDAASVHKNVLPGYYVCGIVGTLSLIMVNSISNAEMRGDIYEGGCLGSCGARAWLFVGFVMGFASVIASCGILFVRFMKTDDHWSGVALFLQNALILISSIVYKFGRSEDVWG